MNSGTDLLSLKDLLSIAKKGAIAFIFVLIVGLPSMYYPIYMTAQNEPVHIIPIVSAVVAIFLGAAIAGFLIGYIRYFRKLRQAIEVPNALNVPKAGHPQNTETKK